MGLNSRIAWTDHTVNLWAGCTKVSTECALCYAEHSPPVRIHGVQWGPHADRYLFKNPWHVLKAAEDRGRETGVKQRVFVESLGDLFDSRPEIAGAQLQLWDWMDTTNHTLYLICTKHPERLGAMLPEFWQRLAPKVWLGTTIGLPETQHRYDLIAGYPAAVHWISHEPGLVPLDLAQPRFWGLDLIVSGGESDQGGKKARPYLSEFDLTHMIGQAHAQKIKFFLKQMGSRWAEEHHSKTTHGDDPLEWPELFQVRQMPVY